MIHEQEYTVKIRIPRKSTQTLEFVEDLLLALMIAQTDGHKDVEMSIITKNGVNLCRNNPNYSFDRYRKGKNIGPNKFSMETQNKKISRVRKDL